MFSLLGCQGAQVSWSPRLSPASPSWCPFWFHLTPLTLNVPGACLVLLSPLSARTPLGGGLPPVCFVQFRIHVDSSQACMSRVCTSSEAETCSSSRCPTSPPGCLLGILDLSCSQLSSSPSCQPAALSGTALLSEGNSVLLVAQTRSLESPPMPPFLSHLSSSQSINPVGSASVIPDSDTHIPPPWLPPRSSDLAYYSSHLPSLPAFSAPSSVLNTAARVSLWKYMLAHVSSPLTILWWFPFSRRESQFLIKNSISTCPAHLVALWLLPFSSCLCFQPSGPPYYSETRQILSPASGPWHWLLSLWGCFSFRFVHSELSHLP